MEDKKTILTCVCGCGSIRFDYYFEDPYEICVTPYALMDRPVVIPDSIWGRIKLAWRVLWGRHPEPTMIIDMKEMGWLLEFLKDVKTTSGKAIADYEAEELGK